MKVVVERAAEPLERALVAGALAAGHDVRVLEPAEGCGPLPRGCRLADGLAGDVVVTVTGGLHGARPADLEAFAQLSRCAADTGVPLVVVARSDLGTFERMLVEAGGPWTLQASTVLHDDVDALFAARAGAGRLAVPLQVALQPVDAGEVAERAVRLLRIGPVERVPDYGGPSIQLVGDLAGAWLRSRPGSERLRLEDVDAEGERWPGAWLTPRRAVGATSWEAWLAHRSGAGPGEGGEQAVGADAGGRRPALLEEA